MLFALLTTGLALATADMRPGCYLGDFVCQVFIGYDGATCNHETNVCSTTYGPSMVPCACDGDVPEIPSASTATLETTLTPTWTQTRTSPYSSDVWSSTGDLYNTTFNNTITTTTITMGDTTEGSPVSTTEASPVSTTEASPVSTTEASPVSTTEASPVSTTEATPVSTTEASPVSTTEASPVSTTEASPVSTTEASPVSTTEASHVNTTDMTTSTTFSPFGGADSMNDVENAVELPYCDDYCIGLNNGKSYCKSWLIEPVCHGGDQSCDPAKCIPNDTHAVESASCDNYCIKQNPVLAGDEVSYCKWWLNAPVCFNGDQPCPPSVCGSGESD